MFSEVLVVCVGNICRSPMAETILHQRLARRSTRIHSAGLRAVLGAPMDRLAENVLRDHDLLPHNHCARQVDRQMLLRADLILTMEQAHLDRLLKLAPETRGRTFLIGRWQHASEVADPYQRGQSAFEQTYRHLSRCIDDWLPYLQSGDSQ